MATDAQMDQVENAVRSVTTLAQRREQDTTLDESGENTVLVEAYTLETTGERSLILDFGADGKVKVKIERWNG
jgi:hypothetical protein